MTRSLAKITAILTAHASKATDLRALLVGMAPLYPNWPTELRGCWRP